MSKPYTSAYTGMQDRKQPGKSSSNITSVKLDPRSASVLNSSVVTTKPIIINSPAGEKNAPLTYSVNTADSDDESKPPPGSPPSSSRITPAPVSAHPLIKGKLNEEPKLRVDPSITAKDLIDLKTLMKEYTTAHKADYTAIMSKLASLELAVNSILTDMEIFKKSSARFVSSGPSSSVGIAKKLDW